MQVGAGVRLWLAAMHLERYAGAFLAQGYDDIDVLCDLNDEVRARACACIYICVCV